VIASVGFFVKCVGSTLTVSSSFVSMNMGVQCQSLEGCCELLRAGVDEKSDGQAETEHHSREGKEAVDRGSVSFHPITSHSGISMYWTPSGPVAFFSPDEMQLSSIEFETENKNTFDRTVAFYQSLGFKTLETDTDTEGCRIWCNNLTKATSILGETWRRRHYRRCTPRKENNCLKDCFRC
jgi:hypothetical protein